MLKLLFQSDLYSTFQVISVINMVFFLQLCRQPIKGFNVPTNWREKKNNLLKSMN